MSHEGFEATVMATVRAATAFPSEATTRRARVAAVRVRVAAVLWATLLASSVMIGEQLLAGNKQPVAAAEPYVPEGRIVTLGEVYGDRTGLWIGLRTCAIDEVEPWRDTCDLIQVTDNPSDRDPAWSPTGRQIAFSREVSDGFYIHVVDVATGDVTRLTSADDAGAPTFDYNPDWSPDGATIVFDREGQIAFVPFRGGGPILAVTLIPRYEAGPCGDGEGWAWNRSNPVYSPDGQSIAYEGFKAIFGESRLDDRHAPPIALAAAGALDLGPSTGVEPLTEGCPGNGVFISQVSSHVGERRFAPGMGLTIAPDWSPDGGSIAVAGEVAPGIFEHFVVDLAGETPVTLVTDYGQAPGGLGGGAAWDPGGEFLIVLYGSASVRFRPDGSGDLDTANQTTTTPGVDVQCLPDDCLTALIIVKELDPLGGQFPATFRYTGGTNGEIVHTGDPLAPPGSFLLWSKIRPGSITVTEEHHPQWILRSISCDSPHTENVAGRTVAFEAVAGDEIICTFMSAAGESEAPPTPDDLLPTPTPDLCIVDGDGDGYCDGIEDAYRTDPRDGASYPVTPPGYWDTRNKMGRSPAPDCNPLDSGIDPCQLQAGDVLVWRCARFTKGCGEDPVDFGNLAERFFGDTYYTHSLLVIGFFDMVAQPPGRASDRLELVVADITPGPVGRAELALSQWSEVGVRGPAAMAVYRPSGLSRPQREAAARAGLHTVWNLGAGQERYRMASIWNAPDGRYSARPDAWGPTAFYCSSFVALAYGYGFNDFRALPRIKSVLQARAISGAIDALFVTPDDLLDGLPEMTRIAGYGKDGRGFSLWSPANLLLTDPQGRRTGRDVEGTVYEEIPDALWRLNEDNESVTAPEVGNDWTVTVSGTGTGGYHLVSHSVGLAGGSTGVIEGTTSPGRIDVHPVGDIPAISGGPGENSPGPPSPMLPIVVAALVAAVSVGLLALIVVRGRRRRA